MIKIGNNNKKKKVNNKQILNKFLILINKNKLKIILNLKKSLSKN